jgi:hypothetical protein
MRRASSKQPVPIQVYRHFAVITLVVTSLLAIFSSGERSEAIAEQVKSHQQKQAMRQAQANKQGGKPLGTSNFNAGKGRSIDNSTPDPVQNEPDRPTSDDMGWSGGQPPPQAFVAPSGQEGPALPVPNSDSLNLAPADLAPGNLAASGAAKPGTKAPRKLTRKEIEKILAATRGRSGSGGTAKPNLPPAGDPE